MAKPHSTKAPAFQFYPKDFLTSPKVRRMSMTERGAYITLLSLCWLDGSLTADLSSLAGELHIPVKQFERMWRGPLSECFIEKGGRLTNERLEKERQKQSQFRRRQSDAAASRWDKQRQCHGNATALPERHSGGNAFRSPISDLQSTTKNKNVSAEPLRDSTPTVLQFPTIGTGDKTWNLTEGQIALWRDAYPNTDVLAECRKAHVWIGANPEKRKTASGMARFLVKWLNRSVETGGLRPVVASRTAGNVAALQRFVKRGEGE